MKKIISIMLIISFLFVFGCGDIKAIKILDKTSKTGYRIATFDTYGFINKDENRNPNVRYRIIAGNVIWAVVLCETIIAPIYFFGFSLYEPVSASTGNELVGEV